MGHAGRDMETIVYREMGSNDVPSAVALRNDVFADHPVTAEAWDADGMLAAIAVLDGEVVGAIPLARRELVIAPNVTIAAPFENSVGTRASMRSRGVGAGMIAAAREFMRDRADGLFVYRGGERTDGYRFYAKTGHHDLMATRAYRLSTPASSAHASPVVLTGGDEIAACAERLLPLFASTYGQHGGYPRRTATAWRRAFSSWIFVQMPTDFFLIKQMRGGDLIGYAVVGVRTRRPDGVARVMEMAVRAADLALASQVLSDVAAFAAERGLEVEMAVSDDDPFVLAMRAAGFSDSARNRFLMGQIIDVPGFFQRTWQDRFPLHGIGLRVSTPLQDYDLSEPVVGYPTLTLEMKEETLHRWLLGRADLGARLREGTVTMYGVPAARCHGVIEAIPWTPWAFHFLDWI